jgi:ATP-dependent DNA ligase
MQTYFEAVKRHGGEGIMLRQSNSPYEAGRSKHLRKYKGFVDTEVRFVTRDKFSRGLLCDQYVTIKAFFVTLID